MSRKYKQAQKRRNKSAVQKYRGNLNLAAYEHWEDCFENPSVTREPSLWQRIASWFRR